MAITLDMSRLLFYTSKSIEVTVGEFAGMNTKQLSKIMKALSNENRLNLYLEIAKHVESDFEEKECTLSDIVKIFGLSPPTISHHLKELANADLIVTEKRGKYLVARINKETLSVVKKVLAGIEGE